MPPRSAKGKLSNKRTHRGASSRAPRDPRKTDAAPTSAKSTASGPARPVASSRDADPAIVKMAGTQEVASAFPFNAAKPSEFGQAARSPAVGQSVEGPDPIVSCSTLSEGNASEKLGGG